MKRRERKALTHDAETHVTMSSLRMKRPRLEMEALLEGAVAQQLPVHHTFQSAPNAITDPKADGAGEVMSAAQHGEDEQVQTQADAQAQRQTQTQTDTDRHRQHTHTRTHGLSWRAPEGCTSRKMVLQ